MNIENTLLNLVEMQLAIVQKGSRLVSMMICKVKDRGHEMLHGQSWWSSFPMEIVKSIACFLLAPISLGAGGFAFYVMGNLLATLAITPGIGFFFAIGLAGLYGCMSLIRHGVKRINNAVAKRKDEQTFIKNCLSDKTMENNLDLQICKMNDSLCSYSIQSETTSVIPNNDLHQKYQKAKKIIQSNKNLELSLKKKILKIIYRAKPSDDIESQINPLLKPSDIK